MSVSWKDIWRSNSSGTFRIKGVADSGSPSQINYCMFDMFVCVKDSSCTAET